MMVLAALPVGLLWPAVVAMLVRPFGVRLPLKPFRFREFRCALQALTLSQHVWVYGALQFGGGMLIATTLWDYLDWKYLNGPAHNFTAGNISGHAVLWFAMGLLFGGVTWKGSPNKAP